MATSVPNPSISSVEALARRNRKSYPRWAEPAIRLVREKPLGAIGAVLVLTVLISASLANVASPYPRDEMHIVQKLQAPSAKYLMGTDQYGRDLLTRIL